MSTHPLLKPSDRVVLLAAINPQSATTVQSSGWVAMDLYESLLAEIRVGTISSSGTVDAKLQQATSSGGAGAKDITGKSITQLTQAGSNSNSQAFINVTAGDLDSANGFNYVQLSITPATAAALITGALYGFDAKFAGANATSVVQVV